MSMAFEMTIARNVVMEYWQSYPQMGTNSTAAVGSLRKRFGPKVSRVYSPGSVRLLLQKNC